MSTSSVGLVILAALIHALWNLFAKKAASVGPVFVAAYSFIAALIYAPWVMFSLMQNSFNWSWSAMTILSISALVHLAYNLSLQRGYQVADLSTVYPIARGTGPLLSSFAAFLFLREAPSLSGVSGLIFVVLGILLIATNGQFRAFQRPEGLLGVKWGMITGALIATYTIVDAVAVKRLGLAPVIIDWMSNVLRVVLLAQILLRDRRRAREAMSGYWHLAILVGILSPLSYILVLTALIQGAPVSLVAPMREMSMMMGALLGLFILRERVGVWRFTGCAILILGVIFLTTS